MDIDKLIDELEADTTAITKALAALSNKWKDRPFPKNTELTPEQLARIDRIEAAIESIMQMQ